MTVLHDIESLENKFMRLLQMKNLENVITGPESSITCISSAEPVEPQSEKSDIFCSSGSSLFPKGILQCSTSSPLGNLTAEFPW